MLEKAYTFTGQGSQRVGMWKDLEASPAAQEVLKATDEILGFRLSKLCTEGPLSELTKTSNAQPAIAVQSLAALAAAEEAHPELFEEKPKFVLGHSVGEYAALVTAGVFGSGKVGLEKAIYLVWQRGLKMEEFGGVGGMVALMGFQDREQVLEICQQTGVETANFNGPSQIILSGTDEQIGEAVRVAGERRVKTGLLTVSHPFHSSLMGKAQEEFAKVLTPLEFKDPTIPVVLNVTGKLATSGAEIKELLAQQIASPVLWEKSVNLVLKEEVQTFLEFGPAPVLTGLLRRINREAKGICVSNFESAQALSW